MKRSVNNPILTRVGIPDIPPCAVDVSSVFNPGAIKLDDRYILLLRVQTRGRKTLFMLAESADGISFRVQPRVLEIEGINDFGLSIFHLYDPRNEPLGTCSGHSYVAARVTDTLPMLQGGREGR